MEGYSVSCAQMKILEKNTDEAGLSYYQMMENAGTIAANRIVEITMTSPINDGIIGGGFSACGKDEAAAEAGKGCSAYMYMLKRPIRARVYCGKGNNGGDGFVVARLLAQKGWDVEIVLVDGEPATPDAIANRELTMQMGIREVDVREVSDRGVAIQGLAADEAGADSGATAGGADGACNEAAKGDAVATARCADVIVDAIYGTGFHGQLREAGAKAAAQIAAARAAGARVFALDIPSGMGGDLTSEEELDSRCVRADVTITFHAMKPVHLQDFAGNYCGRIITADIGIVDPEKDVFTGAGPAFGGNANSEAAGRETSGREAAGRETPGRDAGKAFDLEADETYDFADFVEIISRLRAPDGCPWDRAQTHETLKKYLLEETQEAAEAIDNRDDANFCEELGDVLLQIVLNAQVASERGAFDIGDVIQGISRKMIRRHPWVFGDMHVDTPEEGEKLWEEIKRKEKEKQEKQEK